MASPLQLALEAENSAAKETEYSYFVRLNDEQLTDLVESTRGCNTYVFSETKLVFDKDTGTMGRVRHYSTPNDNSYELTTKKRTGESKTKIETNAVIDQTNYEMLRFLGTSTYVRVRIEIPVKRDGAIVMRKDDTPLAWEVDLYLDGRSSDVVGIHPWVKVELEVDTAALDTVVEMIPFEYSALIEGDTTIAEQRALIDNLHNNDYDVGDTLAGVDNLSTVIKLL